MADKPLSRPRGRDGMVASARHALARVPFATALWLAVAWVGIRTGTWAYELHPAKLERWGDGLGQLWQGRWWTVFTDIVFVHGPLMFWAILVFIPASVGVYEWLAGTRRALLVFWATDLGSSLFVAFGVVLPLYLSGAEAASLLPFDYDVGMSGGGSGCAGAALNHLPRRWRRPAIGAATVYLVVRLATLIDFRADALHLVAFVAGLALGRWRGGLDALLGEQRCRD
jgi:hypothetical protein